MWTLTRYGEVTEDLPTTRAIQAVCETRSSEAYATEGERLLTWDFDNNWINDGGSAPVESRWKLYDDFSGLIRTGMKSFDAINVIAANKIHEANNPGVLVWAEEDGTKRRLTWDNDNDWIKVEDPS
jgi:hypothetical protein